jgi:hypothetical protein
MLIGFVLLVGHPLWFPGGPSGSRAAHQPQDCQDPRPHDPAVAAGAGGSGDRLLSRKGAKSHTRPAKRDETQNADAAPVSILPMEIQVGDRFSDAEGEWEVVGHLATLHGAKTLRARVRRTDQPGAERHVTWPAHVRVEIRQGSSQE